MDIIAELQDYDLDIQIHDPEADVEEARAEYGIELMTAEQLQPARAVILAVAHREYVANGWDYVSSLLGDEGGLVFDVKGVLDRERKPDNIMLKTTVE